MPSNMVRLANQNPDKKYMWMTLAVYGVLAAGFWWLLWG